MSPFPTRNTLVHRSSWAGQATNESQGWVNNQLPALISSASVPCLPFLGNVICAHMFGGSQVVWSILKPVSHSRYLKRLCPQSNWRLLDFQSKQCSTTSRTGLTGHKCVCMHMDVRVQTHMCTLCRLICPIWEIKAPQAVSNQTENEGTPTK